MNSISPIWKIKDKSTKKNALIYLIICVLFGGLGAHRFYRRQYGLGILYLFTAGIFLIGWLIDIIIAIFFSLSVERSEVPVHIGACSPSLSKITRQGKYRIFINGAEKKWSILGPHVHKTYNFSDIIDYKVEENGTSIMQGKSCGAVLGALTFGAVGAVIGASGKRRVKEYCNSLILRITVNDFNNPAIIIKYIKYPVPKGYGTYSRAMKKIGEFTSLLSFMQSNGNVKKQEQSSEIEAIQKLSVLKEQGIITEEEFSAKKKKLLGI